MVLVLLTYLPIRCTELVRIKNSLQNRVPTCAAWPLLYVTIIGAHAGRTHIVEPHHQHHITKKAAAMDDGTPPIFLPALF